MSVQNLYFRNLKTCRYLLKFSYIGTNYKGVQRQSRRIDDDNYSDEDGTIQSAIEKALNRALCPVYGSRLALSSRTDSGVHAYQNSANVDLTHPFADTLYKPSFITEATNQQLAYSDHEITLHEARLVPSYFHSRINAKWRSYLYRIAVVTNKDNQSSQQILYKNLRGFLPVSQINRCHIVNNLDLDLVMQCISMFKGEHDFASFSTKNKDSKLKPTVKCIEEFELKRCNPLTEFEQQNSLYSKIEFYEFYIKSKSFLYNQVRRMVSTVIDVGLKRITLNEVQKMLEVPFYKPNSLSQMAPACGLYLYEIGYDEDDMILHDNFIEYAPKAYYRDDLFDSEPEE